MTHRFHRFFLPLFLLGAMASTAVGQQEGSGAKTPEQKLAEQRLQPRIGLFGNLGLNIHSSQFFGIPGTPNCMALDDVGFTGGTGMGYAAGLTFELPFDEQFRLIARQNLDQRRAVLSHPFLLRRADFNFLIALHPFHLIENGHQRLHCA
ncbi:MAG: hypothetical protein DYG96_16290 [Chlorobi bacterium CHB2]|nr:hypothetical protein [Chlorobi bacterium CHB2]